MVSISVVGSQIHWPRVCPCCGSDADSTLDTSWSEQEPSGATTVIHTRKTRVPYCQNCKRHVPVQTTAITLIAASVGCLLAVTVAAVMSSSSHQSQLEALLAASAGGVAAALPALAVCGILNWSRAKRRGPQCVTEERAVELSFEPGSNVTTFTFHNDKYADVFSTLNADIRTY